MGYRIGTLSEGFVHNGRLMAICECGWKGPWRPGLSDSVVEVDLDLEEHAATHEEGARREPFFVQSARGIAYHRACGNHHSLADDCPLPPNSPAGWLRAALCASSSSQEIGRHRLESIVALVNRLDEEAASAVVGLRSAGADWDEIEARCPRLDWEGPERWLEVARDLDAVGWLRPLEVSEPSVEQP